MKTISLAGGLGTRFAAKTEHRPKPIIEINGKPILHHIIEIFFNRGFNDLEIAASCKSEAIFEWARSVKPKYNV